MKGRVVFDKDSFLDDIGLSTSLIFGDFSFKDCTSLDSLRFKLDGPKGDVAEESSEIGDHLVSIKSSDVYKNLPEERDSKNSAKALERISEDGRLLKTVSLLKHLTK